MRYPYFDNAKAFLIFLVVLGHLIVLRGDVGEEMYWLIYSFHMPAFIFIAGYFTKMETWKDTIVSSIGQFIIPYFLFQSLYNLYNYYLFDMPINQDFAQANFALWFLLAMVYWKITLQIILRWKWTMGFFALLIITHRFFIADLNYLAIGRAITFSLFFYLGHLAKSWTPMILAHLQKIKFRTFVFPMVGVIGLITTTWFYEKGWIGIKRQWFYGKFDNMDKLFEQYTVIEFVIFQLTVFLFSLLMVGFFLMLVPTKEYHWTSIGGATLSVYLLHGFIRNLFVHGDYLYQANTWGEFLTLVALSLLIVYILSRKPFHLFVTFLTSLTKKKQN